VSTSATRPAPATGAGGGPFAGHDILDEAAIVAGDEMNALWWTLSCERRTAYRRETAARKRLPRAMAAYDAATRERRWLDTECAAAEAMWRTTSREMPRIAAGAREIERLMREQEDR
jgi:hypothetical protein